MMALIICQNNCITSLRSLLLHFVVFFYFLIITKCKSGIMKNGSIKFPKPKEHLLTVESVTYLYYTYKIELEPFTSDQNNDKSSSTFV